MSVFATYGHVVVATVHRRAWPTAWLALLSQKGRLQSVNAWRELRIGMEATHDDRLEVHVETTWSDRDALEVWAARGEFEELFRTLDPPAQDIVTKVRDIAL